MPHSDHPDHPDHPDHEVPSTYLCITNNHFNIHHRLNRKPNPPKSKKIISDPRPKNTSKPNSFSLPYKEIPKCGERNIPECTDMYFWIRRWVFLTRYKSLFGYLVVERVRHWKEFGKMRCFTDWGARSGYPISGSGGSQVSCQEEKKCESYQNKINTKAPRKVLWYFGTLWCLLVTFQSSQCTRVWKNASEMIVL